MAFASNRWKITAALLAVLFVGAALFVRFSPDGALGGKELTKIKVGYTALAANLPLFVAVDNGFFEKEGIAVELVKFGNTNQVMDALERGEIDATGSVAFPTLFALASKGSEFKAYLVTQDTIEHPNEFLIVGTASPIINVSELEGKKIATHAGNGPRELLKQTLRGLGIEPEKVEIVQLATELQIPALANGAVDAVLAVEPSGTLAIEKNVGRVLVEAPYLKILGKPRFPISAFVASKEFAAKAGFEKYSNAVYRAVDYADSNAESRSVLSKYLGLEEPIARKMSIVDFVKPEEADRVSIQEFADLLARTKVLDAPVDISKFI